MPPTTAAFSGMIFPQPSTPRRFIILNSQVLALTWLLLKTLPHFLIELQFSGRHAMPGGDGRRRRRAAVAPTDETGPSASAQKILSEPLSDPDGRLINIKAGAKRRAAGQALT